MAKKGVDLEIVVDFKSVPPATDVVKMLTSVKDFSSLKFSVVKESPTQAAKVGDRQKTQLVVSKDCSQRPKLLRSLCNLVDVLIAEARKSQKFTSVCERDSDISYWNVTVKRVSPTAHKGSWPTVSTNAQNIFLLGERGASEFIKSRHVYTQRNSGRALTIQDATMSLVHIPALVAWGVVPTWDKTQGELLYADTGEKDNYIVSIAAPNVGLADTKVVSALSAHGFALAPGCDLTKRIVPRNSCPDHKFTQDDEIKMACAKFAAFEEDERPGREARTRKKKEAMDARCKKRKESEYCSNCVCEACKKKRRP